LIAAFVSPSARGQEVLVNGGFESGTAGWNSLDASLAPSPSARSGNLALAITSTSFAQAVNAFQERAVNAGWGYDFSAWVVVADADIQRAFLRITWLDSANAPISTEDTTWLGAPSGVYQHTASGMRVAPTGAAAARLVVMIVTSGPFTALVDDASLTIVSAPTAPPPLATPAPTAPPTQQPTAGPSPVPTPNPASTTAPTIPVPTSVTETEPDAFDALTTAASS
jgi:hypothetical protein